MNEQQEIIGFSIQHGFEEGPPFDPKRPARAPTGEPYQDLYGTGGEEGAVAAFREYAKDKVGKLYWRTRPERQGDKFYMRLLISNKGS